MHDYRAVIQESIVPLIREGDTFRYAVEDAKELIKCKRCKYFNKDYWEVVDGKMLIVAHDICEQWAYGIETDPEGFCFMAEEEGPDD